MRQEGINPETWTYDLMMKKWQTGNGITVHHVLWGRSNVYLIDTDKGNILVDTGPSAAYERLLKHINQVVSSPDDVELLILTHSHFDHCQNASALKEKYYCKILMGSEEEEYARQGYTPLPRGTNFFTSIVSTIGNMVSLKRFGYDPIQPDILVEKDYELPGFDSISVITTAGHSKGSVSVVINHEIALVGDTLFGIFKGSVFPPFADNVKKLKESWNKLLNTGCTLFLPGHGKPVKRNLLQREYDKFSTE